MATKSLLVLYIMVILSITNFGFILSSANQETKTWCVAKPSSDEASLRDVLSFACSFADCRAIQAGGPCHEPKSLLSHASVAMNAYYQSRGRNPWNCYFNRTGIVATMDPSFSNCQYD